MPLRSRFLLSAAALLLGATLAHADVLSTSDGRTYDGTIVKEDDSHVWIKCVPGRVFKVALSDVSERKEESPSGLDRYLELKGRTSKEANSTEAWWNYYAFLADQAELSPDEKAQKAILKDAEKAMKKLLKLDPDHAQGREANGEVQYEGQWIKAADLERKKAEIERRKLIEKWEERVGVPVQVHQGERWLLVDATDEPDLIGRSEQLHEAYRLACEVLGVEDLWGGPALVITLPNKEDYHRMVDLYQKEVWHMSEAWVAIAKADQTGGAWRQAPEPMQVAWPIHGPDAMWSFLVNNVGHMSIWKRWRRSPVMAWLEEGLAAWLETEVMGEQITTSVGFRGKGSGGGTTDRRAGDDEKKDGESLRDAQNEWRDAFIEAVENDDFPPLRKFLSMELGEYGPAEEGGALGLVTYLLQRGPDKFQALERALQSSRNYGDRSYDLDPPFKAVFDVEVVEDFEKEFRRWVISEW